MEEIVLTLANQWRDHNVEANENLRRPALASGPAGHGGLHGAELKET